MMTTQGVFVKTPEFIQSTRYMARNTLIRIRTLRRDLDSILEIQVLLGL